MAIDQNPDPADPRESGIEQVGTPLRDAAVDPRPGDFLAPTNAGEENPHGKLVVSPGIHGSETGPIAPGIVSSDPATQDEKESDLAEAVFVENEDVKEATAAAADFDGEQDVQSDEPDPADTDDEH